MMDEKTLNFWNECHKTQNVIGLTGSKYENTINFLKIKDFIKRGINVLEVGVGQGFTLKGFHDIGANVSGVDISETALNCVKSFCEKTYTVDEISNLPENYFDLIVFYNVIQHVFTSVLLKEIEYCLKSLKKDGLMAIQFVSTPDLDDGGLNADSNEGQSFFRSKDYMEKLINNLGGNCELVYDAVRFYSPTWQNNRSNSGYGEIEYASHFVTIPLPCKKEMDNIKNTITGNHVFHIRKK